MATYEAHIEGLTNVPIGDASTDYITFAEFNEVLRDGVISTVNIIINTRPEEINKFTATTNSTGVVLKAGKVSAVLREHNSQTILRPCTPISASLRYEATDSESLHYRSKYNPGFFEKDGYINCVPTPNDATDNDLVVTQVYYDTGLVYSDNYNAAAVAGFPVDYEHLLALYAASRVCWVAANHIQNNMPTKPTAPDEVFLLKKDIDIPELPTFNTAILEVDYSQYTIALSNEDLEMADKQFKIIEKKIEEYDKRVDMYQKKYESDFKEFDSKLQTLIKDTDRFSNIEATEYKNKLEKYVADTAQYNSELQEESIQYKWYMEQSMNFLSNYMTSLAMPSPQNQPRQEERAG
jgi:hypothetical protein